MENDERASLIDNNYGSGVNESGDGDDDSGYYDNYDNYSNDNNDNNGSSSNSNNGSINSYRNIYNPSITSSPIYGNNNNKSIQRHSDQQQQQQQEQSPAPLQPQYQEEEEEEKEKEEEEEEEEENIEIIHQEKETIFTKIWNLFFSLSINDDSDNSSNIKKKNNNKINNTDNKINSSIEYVDENQKYMKQEDEDEISSTASSSSTSSSSIPNSKNNKQNNININDDNNNNNTNEIDGNRIYDLFFSLSATTTTNTNSSNLKRNNDKIKQTENVNNNNNIKYNNFNINDNNDKKKFESIKQSQKSTENILSKSQEQQNQQHQEKQDQPQQQEQEQEQEQSIQKTPKIKSIDEPNLFDKSPFFEAVRPTIDLSDPIFLEPIESKLPGNLEKNKHLYENIKPNPIPLSVILTGVSVFETTEDGKIQENKPPLLLTSFYQRKRVVLAIFRRFGCLICRLQALDLSSLKPKFDKLGIELIGVGFDEFGLAEFKKMNFFAGKIYLDPTRSVYRALDLKRRSKLTTYELFLDPRVFVYLKRIKELGVTANYRKDGFQLGATMVLGPQPQEQHYDFRPQRYADIFDLKEIWAACLKPYPNESEILASRKIDFSIPKPITLDDHYKVPIKFDMSYYNSDGGVTTRPVRGNTLSNISFNLPSNQYILNEDQEEFYKEHLQNLADNDEDEEYDDQDEDIDEEYYDDQDYGDQEYYNNQDDEEYSDIDDYDNPKDDQDEDYNDDEEEDEDEEVNGVKLPKPSRKSVLLSKILNSVKVNPEVFKSATSDITIYTKPILEGSTTTTTSLNSNQPESSTNQEQNYVDNINTSYFNNQSNNSNSFYKVSKSSKFILKDKDELENQLIYSPYKFNL